MWQMSPFQPQIDDGYGWMAESYKEAGDRVLDFPRPRQLVGIECPTCFLYRHSIELYLKSLIVVLHRTLELPFGDVPHDAGPKVRCGDGWRPIYTVHRISDLYAHFRALIRENKATLDANTRTDWSTIPEQLDEWMTRAGEADPGSTFFRYPVTSSHECDALKSPWEELDSPEAILKVGLGQAPIHALLILNEEEEIVRAYKCCHDVLGELQSVLRQAAEALSVVHFAIRAELAGGW